MSSNTKFFDLSGFLFMYQSQNLEYQQSITIFQTIFSYNSNVSTLRAGGASNLTYYQFATNKEKTMYTKGRYLLVQSYPGSNFTPPEEN